MTDDNKPTTRRQPTKGVRGGRPFLRPPKDKIMLVEEIRFVSAFDFFDREESGIKPYTIRDYLNLPPSKYDKINRFMRGESILQITISRGYTKRCIRHTVTDVLLWKDQYGDVIISWNPNEENLYARK